jgi:hypothetical protein
MKKPTQVIAKTKPASKVAARYLLEKKAMIPHAVTAVAQKVSAFLEKHGVEHAIAGGMAVSLHGIERMTKDVDIVISESDRKTVEKLGPSKPISGYLDGITIKVDNIDVDFLFLRGVVRQKDIASPKQIAGLPIMDVEPIAAMKFKAGRSQDEADVIRLLKLGKVPIAKVMKRLPDASDREDFKTLVTIAELEKKGDTKTAGRMFRETMVRLATKRAGQ